MGEVAIIYGVNPELEKKDKVKENLIESGAKEVKEEDIGFGIVKLKAVFVMEDRPGLIEELEKKLEAIEGINSINVEATTLI